MMMAYEMLLLPEKTYRCPNLLEHPPGHRMKTTKLPKTNSHRHIPIPPPRLLDNLEIRHGRNPVPLAVVVVVVAEQIRNVGVVPPRSLEYYWERDVVFDAEIGPRRL